VEFRYIHIKLASIKLADAVIGWVYIIVSGMMGGLKINVWNRSAERKINQ